PFFLYRLHFNDVFARKGGFDVVVANPPYFNVETLGKHSPVVASIKAEYPTIWMDKSDILFYFIARGLQLGKHLVYITSRAFLEAAKAQKLREYILNQATIRSIFDFR